MQRRKSRQRELVRRLLIYVLMIVTIIALLVILVLTVTGYRYNFSTQTVEQTGLVQYDSYPRGALVMVDGKGLETTQTKGMVLPGQHQFSMSLRGYENWQKTVEIKSGTVTWLSYVKMVPIEKNIHVTDNLPALTDALASPDNRFMAGISTNESNIPELTLIDFRDSRQPKTEQFTLDVTGMTGYGEGEDVTLHSIDLRKWSGNSRYLLMKHQYTLPDQPQKIEWLWLDRESPEEIVNISSLLNLPITDIQIADGRNIYILQENGDVRRADISDGTITRPLISGVNRFQLYANNTIAYTGKKDDFKVAGVWRRDWQQPTVLMSVPVSNEEPISIGVSKYFNEDTVVIAQGANASIYRGNLPSSQQAKELFMQSPKTFTLNRPIGNLQFSDNGRFIVVEDEDGMVSYDIEHATVSQEVKKYHSQPIQWLDGYHIWQVDDSGKLFFQEFDGMNGHQMMPADEKYDALITQDNRFMYSLRGNEQTGEIELNRLQMVLTN